VLDALFDGGTAAHALNDAGMTTGDSGVNSLPPGTHAFLGSPDGSIENIETLSCDISEGHAINNSNQVAGSFTVFPGQQGISRPFRYTPGVGMIDLGTPYNSSGGSVDINEGGDVIGTWRIDFGAEHSFLFTDQGGIVDLGTLGAYSTKARDINDARQIVGESWTADWKPHAVLWEDGVLHDLGTLGGDQSSAYYLNNAGVIVGSSKIADGSWRAFRYTTDGGMEALPTMPGATYCAATWITETGIIIGQWEDADFHTRIFYYTDDEGLVDIGIDAGTTSWVGTVAANNSGQILLVTMDELYQTHPFVYIPGLGAYDLNTVLAQNIDLTLTAPTDINESGQITATGYDVNHWVSVVLTPVPPGDLDLDGDVDQQDLGILLADWGCTGPDCVGDCDGDGDTDQGDLGVLLANWGSGT